ncbi:aldehyde dehydrogenase family protein [Streptomyces odonnellii]|uniref:aldehyde dehydrogenase family protein n=1 Tax=Streptomyces odonnellii TaxID=1417980 RepID=UPI00099C48E7|nr:aldehyde dehydrogenase family protein [Streptomyces odonnellii]
MPPLLHPRHVKRPLKRWMRPRRRFSGALVLIGVRNCLVYEPLGVVGIMSPFNAPVSLAFDPAIEALAAGNSVIIKPSESTPRLTALFKELVAESFDERGPAVVEGDAQVSAHVAALPWDKFLFTGGTEIGRKVLAAAAPHLTPVILELGGEGPAFILLDSDIDAMGSKIAQGRLGNGGQVCLAVDCALVPEEALEPRRRTAQEQRGFPHPARQSRGLRHDRPAGLRPGQRPHRRGACTGLPCHPARHLRR